MNNSLNKVDIVEWIHANPKRTSLRNIAKAFGVDGPEKKVIKQILKELAQEGELKKSKANIDPREEKSTKFPPISVLRVIEVDCNGELIATPEEWQGRNTPPDILLVTAPKSAPFGIGDKVLARVSTVLDQDHKYEARPIRQIEESQTKIIGVFRRIGGIGRIMPIDKSGTAWRVERTNENGAKNGELVEAMRIDKKSYAGAARARVLKRLGNPSEPKAMSLIAIHQNGIPDTFSPQVLEEAAKYSLTDQKTREDFRHLPFVTIDPAGARDHDDAVYAEPDRDPQNIGGHLIWVAIADVAHFVRYGTELDREARRRGNSTYFPDRVVPMLPEVLSGDLCSLHQGKPRYCIAVCLQITAQGRKISHTFHRAIICSVASLTYSEVQEGIDGKPNDKVSVLLDSVVRPLYEAYAALRLERQSRQPLELDLPERVVCLNSEGRVGAIEFKERLDAHRLIEEFMVLANVAAAETLGRKRESCLYRVHEEPDQEKINALRETAQSVGLNLAKGQALQTKHLNRLLQQAEDQKEAELISISTLRAMSQAYYCLDNFGHFGLALGAYAHFTSPIRRYADLVVHRALIKAHNWGQGGLESEEEEILDQTAELISMTERRSMAAERDTIDRYLALYLADRIDSDFPGRISGVAKFGIFISLDKSGAEGLVPIRSLGREYFNLDKKFHKLVGSESGYTLSLGQSVNVRLLEAKSETGGLIFELLDVEGSAPPLQFNGSKKNRKKRFSRVRTKGKKNNVKRSRR